MCGVAGVFGQSEAASWTCEALFAQQHRGQDSCGLCASDGERLHLFKGMGLVKEAVPPSLLKELPGHGAIGHVRYPTQGEATLPNAQPFLFVKDGTPLFALASNGDITNLPELREEIEKRSYRFDGTNDGEVIAKAIGSWAFDDGMGIEAAIAKWMRVGMGAYSTLLLTPTEFYAFRDPHGFRPLSVGEKDGAAVLTSETVGLDILRARFIEHIPAGAIRRWGPGGPRSSVGAVSKKLDHCIFEHIYFARPDSYVFGEKVFEVRRRIGEALASGDTVQADAVVPIPDSANYIGMGYANARNIPIVMGLVRNHYVGRTFIAPVQLMRDETVRLKFNPLPGFFEGQRVVLVDDSIVRGTTIRKLVRMLRENGAKEVHLRIGSPPIRYSCYYGIDTPDRKYLIAAERSPEQVADVLSADTLRYLTLEGLHSTVSKPGDYCYACFTGDYPAGKKRA